MGIMLKRKVAQRNNCHRFIGSVAASESTITCRNDNVSANVRSATNKRRKLESAGEQSKIRQQTRHVSSDMISTSQVSQLTYSEYKTYYKPGATPMDARGPISSRLKKDCSSQIKDDTYNVASVGMNTCSTRAPTVSGRSTSRTPPITEGTSKNKNFNSQKSCWEHLNVFQPAAAISRNRSATPPPPYKHGSERNCVRKKGAPRSIQQNTNVEKLNESMDDYQIAEDDDGCIITPNKTRIKINQYLMKADLTLGNSTMNTKPSTYGACNYTQDFYIAWKNSEDSVDPRSFQLILGESKVLQAFRTRSIRLIFDTAIEAKYSISTIHSAIINTNRVLLHFKDKFPLNLTANLIGGTVAASFRMSIKHEETPEKCRNIREIPSIVCRLLSQDRVSKQGINAAETDCLKILGPYVTLPTPHQFLERYLVVGSWPEPIASTSLELARFLIDLSTFHRPEDDLTGLRPSVLAASALSLAIRIIGGGIIPLQRYENWPQRLVVYTGYTSDDIRRGVRGISRLLRDRPSASEVLNSLHEKWGSLDWQ